MLTLTDKAVNVIQTLTSRADLPDSAGLRIVARIAEDEGDQGGLALSLAQGPTAGDEVIDAGPVHVYLEADAAEVLDDKQLDATVSAQGDVQFLLGPQL